jgi:hypothetical protein
MIYGALGKNISQITNNAAVSILGFLLTNPEEMTNETSKGIRARRRFQLRK